MALRLGEMETSEQAKSRWERAVFDDFRERAGFPEPGVVTSPRPPEPDILCVFKSGGELALELAEICAQSLARDLVEVGRDPFRKPEQRWPPNPTEAIYRQKIGKTYSRKAVGLLLYADGRNIIPDDVVQVQLDELVRVWGNGPFSRIWFMSPTVCYEIGR
jgi:hypothetical protein